MEDRNGEEIIEPFYEKELQKINQIQFRTVTILKKIINYRLSGRVILIRLIAVQIKKDIWHKKSLKGIKMSQYFPKPYERYIVEM